MVATARARRSSGSSSERTSASERIGHGGGEAIDAAPVDGVLSQAEAHKGEGVIADPTDPVFGLPWLVALNARPCVEDVVPAESDEGGGARLRGGLQLMGGAEESAEVRAARAEFLCGCHRHVDLQTTGQKEYAVDTRAGAQVEMVEHAEFPIEHLRPVMKDGLRRDAFGDPEGNVDVGPVVPSAKGCGAGERTGCDPWVGPRQFEDAMTHVVAVLRSEHFGLLSSHCKEYYHTGTSKYKL